MTTKIRIALAVLLALVSTLTGGCGPTDADDGDTFDDATGTVTSAVAQPSCLVADSPIQRFPLNGENGRAWMINGYVDLDPAPGATMTMDYMLHTGASARTYDGHEGMDIDIPSFRAMDRDVAVVYSVAPGVVEYVVQDQPDRNTTRDPNRQANLVRVRHANGFAFIYAHLKQSSVGVVQGQSVFAGTALGVAGSSGDSSQPHLHFEVRGCKNGRIDTLKQAMWIDPPVYDSPSDVMGIMLQNNSIPSVDQIKDPLPDTTSMRVNRTLGVGLSAAVRGGDVLEAVLIRPGAGGRASYKWTVTSPPRLFHGYLNAGLAVGGTPGVATLNVSVDGIFRMARTLTLTQ